MSRTGTDSSSNRHTPAIKALAAGQKDLITQAQLLAAGITSRGIRKRVERGALHHRHRGVYSLGPAPLSREAQMLAAVLAAGPGSYISRAALAELHGITRQRAPLLLSFLRETAPSKASESTATERSIPVTSQPTEASRTRRSTAST